MKPILTTLFISLCRIACYGQTIESEQIKAEVKKDQALAPLYHLASDQLMGRDLFRPEIALAAHYISDEFEKAGLLKFSGFNNYQQSFPVTPQKTPYQLSLKIGNHSFVLKRSIVQAQGLDQRLIVPVSYIEDLNEKSLSDASLKNKFVVIAPWSKGDIDDADNGIRKARLLLMKTRPKAFAIIFPAKGNWDSVANKYTDPTILSSPTDIVIPTFFIKDDGSLIHDIKQGNAKASLFSASDHSEIIYGQNIIGWVKGTDPQYNDQYIILSAHYDHIGVSKIPEIIDGKPDSIYNGARDNASGTTAIIDAARYFSLHPTKRSIIFIAYSGEEKGLLGSAYFAEHPVVPLRKIVCNLNIDNAGYNDTTIITLFGSGKTNLDPVIHQSTKRFGLTTANDPIPEMGLFNDSDNASLAKKGVPAITFSLGFTKFDDSILRYLHHLTDETSNLDMNYILKYIQAYINAAETIANDPSPARWSQGDEHEELFNKLYGR